MIEVIRILVVIVCFASLILMTHDFYKYHDDWNQKTRDYWYGRVMWTLVGISGGIEGTLRHTPFRYSLVLLIAAALATLKGNLQRGKWGGDDDESKGSTTTRHSIR